MSVWTQITAAAAAPSPGSGKSPYTPLFMLTMWMGCCVGVFALLLAAWQTPDLPRGLRLIGWCLMGMLASLAVGGFLGLLFGIPRIDNPAQFPADALARVRIRQNDSLEQIADWLTKTIVGVSLVQSREIAAVLVEVSGRFSVEVFGLPKGAYVPGMATIVAFGIIGFLLAYVWARRYWVLEILDTTDRLGGPCKPSLDEALQALDNATQSNETVADSSSLKAMTQDGKRWSNTPEPAENINDPWYGQFGGKATDAVLGRRLRIEFRNAFPGQLTGATAPSAMSWVQLRLVVESTDPVLKPLDGLVRFFLHNTFPNPIREVAVRDGIAVVELRAWGGDFTVGVQTDAGACQLEQHVASVAPDWTPIEWRKS